MLLRISEFRDRIENGMDQLIADLQALTHRYSHAEEQAWRSSLPKVSKAFSAPSFENLDLYFGSHGNLSLEYKMPAASAWADMVLLGRHLDKPAAVIVELKDWITQGDLPGPVEGLMQRHGQCQGHPSDQVRGYTEYCRRFHSAVHEYDAAVHGCVIFTKDPFYHAYALAPNAALTALHPCFSLEKDDVATRLPDFFKDRLTEPDREFALKFENGVYKQSRGFVQHIGEQILKREESPFVLLDNQRRAFALVRARVSQATLEKRPKKTVILIEGPPGSGKSVVAAKVWASLVTDPRLREGNVVIATTSASQSSNWRYLFQRGLEIAGAQGVVVSATGYTPLNTGQFGALRRKYPDAFQPEPLWRENLKMLRSLAPTFRSGSQDNEFLVSIVDEAHALINPEHVEGRGQFGFTTAFGPQAYHIMRASTVSVFLLDSQQGFRDQENTNVSDIMKWAGELGVEVFEEISLAGSQYRCAGSKDYVDWVDFIFGFPSIQTSEGELTAANAVPLTYDQKRASFSFLKAAENIPTIGARRKTIETPFAPFEMKFVDTLDQLEAGLRIRIEQGHTARLLASYARKWKTKRVALPHNLPPHLMDFHEAYNRNGKIEYWSKIWNYVPNGNDYTHYIQGRPGSMISDDPLCEVGCPYVVRGFDFDYVGLLWFSDLTWRSGRWVIDTDHVFESGINRRIAAAGMEDDASGPAHAALLRSVQEAYRIILTRPMKGLFVWCEDAETRSHLETSIQMIQGIPSPPLT